MTKPNLSDYISLFAKLSLSIHCVISTLVMKLPFVLCLGSMFFTVIINVVQVKFEAATFELKQTAACGILMNQ